MHLSHKIFVCLAFLALAACADPKTGADRVFTNGVVWTGQSDSVDAQAFAVKDGRIVAVGADADMLPHIGMETEQVNLNGAFVVPGLIDNHVHFDLGSFGLTRVNLRNAATPEVFTRLIGEAAAEASEGEWIQGGSWDHELWGGTLPDRTWVDAVTGDVPLAVSRLDEHMVLVNSAALKLAGIDDTTPDPEGGVIVRDETGRATGILKDTAMTLLEGVIPAPTDAQMEAAFRRGMKHAASKGVTQVHDMGWNWSSFDTFRRMHKRGELTLRVYAFTQLADWQLMADFVSEHGRGDDWLRWGGVKGFVDGSLGSSTAWFYEDFSDEPGNSGLPLLTMEELGERMKGASDAGLHMAIHAIGFQANDRLMDIFEGLGAGKERRHRVEHAQHLTAEAIPRFADLGVVASMHPYSIIDDGRWAGRRLGPNRLAGTYAMNSLLAAGTTVTFGSDWPVTPLDPMEGIYAAVTRATIDGKMPEGWIPEEKVSVLDALRAYTVNNAYGAFMDDRLGQIKEGYLADFVVLDQNLFEIDPAAIRDTRVLRTVIDGTDRYVAGGDRE